MNKKDDLFIKIKALAHALDKLIENDTTSELEDINVLSLILVNMIDEYDKMRNN